MSFNYTCIDDEKCSGSWDSFETVCPDVCENSAYHISVSSFTWPDAKDIVAFYKEYIEKGEISSTGLKDI